MDERRLTLENAQVSLTMANYAKAPYGCVVPTGFEALRLPARITRVSSCLRAHPKVTSYDDEHGAEDPWILAFPVVKDPAPEFPATINRATRCCLSVAERRVSFPPSSATSPNSERHLTETSRRVDLK